MSMTTILCILAVLVGAAFLAFRLFKKPEAQNEPDVVRVTRKNRASSAKAE